MIKKILAVLLSLMILAAVTACKKEYTTALIANSGTGSSESSPLAAEPFARNDDMQSGDSSESDSGSSSSSEESGSSLPESSSSVSSESSAGETSESGTPGETELNVQSTGEGNSYTGSFLQKYYAYTLCRGRHDVSLTFTTTYKDEEVDVWHVVNKSNGNTGLYSYTEFTYQGNIFNTVYEDGVAMNIDHSIRYFYPNAKPYIPLEFLEDNFSTDEILRYTPMQGTVEIDGITYICEYFEFVHDETKFVFNNDGDLIYIVNKGQVLKIKEVNSLQFDYNWLGEPNRYTAFTVSGM